MPLIDHVRAIASGQVTAQRGGSISDADLLELFDSQMVSRQLDLMARVKRLENKVFYTIGSSGHEGNTLVGRPDPSYRSGVSALPVRRLHGRALSPG